MTPNGNRLLLTMEMTVGSAGRKTEPATPV